MLLCLGGSQADVAFALSTHAADGSKMNAPDILFHLPHASAELRLTCSR